MKRDEDYLKLVDGVKVLNFGSGHAWGMIGLEIETEELGTIILASDAIYTKEVWNQHLNLQVSCMIRLVGQIL